MNPHFEAISFEPLSDPFERFSKSERKIMEERLHILSSLAYFIGKDYGMRVEVNQGQGWHWNFDENVVRADPDELLNKPIEYLRCLISHEAGHVRISRVVGVVPEETWQLPGFSFMMNAIEDPRDNNFVADNIPHFREEMRYKYGDKSEWKMVEDEMCKAADKKLKKRPRFMKAGLEYMKLWYKVSVGEKPELSPGLPDDVRDVVLKTYEAAKRSWNTYPSLKEADSGMVLQGRQLTGEETITEYARASFQINYKEVWPLFKTLIDKDIEDVKNNKKENSDKKDRKDDSQGGDNEDVPEQGGNEGNQDIPEQADGGGEDEIPLTEEEAVELIKEFAEKLAEFFEGEKIKADIAKKTRALRFDPQDGEEKGEGETYEDEVTPEYVPGGENPKPFALDDEAIDKLKQKLEQRGKSKTPYENVLSEYAPLIDLLTNELQEIFNKRRHTMWEAGYKSGKKLHIGKAIQEEVTQVSPFDTGAFMRREQPREADYAVTLLVDLSYSMILGGKIQEAFKGAIILAEVLNTLSISFDVTGFNMGTVKYKNFAEDFGDKQRDGFNQMLKEVKGGRSMGTRDGSALSEVYNSLQKVEQKEKIIFVISDGESDEKLLLKSTVASCVEKGYKVIGLGLGKGTQHVKEYYPNSVANIDVQELANVLGGKLREAIEGV